MRNIHIGVISPYDAMLPLIDELVEEQSDLTIIAEAGDLEQGVELARKMERQGADILISRGGTAKLIREAVTLPVIDIHISGYDLLRSIMLATGHSKEKKALVGFPNITLGAAAIISLLEIEMKVVSISHASEVESILLQLKRDGYTEILGDVITRNAAGRLGLNGLLIQSGQESILEAFAKARQLFKSQQKNQQVLRVLRQLLDESKQDVILLNDKGQVLFENWSVFQHPPITEAEISHLLKQVLETRTEYRTTVKETKSTCSIHTKLIDDPDGTLILFSFKNFPRDSGRPSGIKIAAPIQLPSFVAESKDMKQIKGLLEEPGITSESIALIGPFGTGKKTLAKYLHAFHQKTGLFIHLQDDADLDKIGEIELLPDSTLVVEFNSSPRPELIDEIQKLLATVDKNSVQLIYLLPSMPPNVIKELKLMEAVKVHVPPLDSRKDDIGNLARQFLTEFHQDLGTRPIRLRDDAMAELSRYDWPENLNGLKEYVKKLALLEKNYVIELETLNKVPLTPEFHQAGNSILLDKKDTLKEIEKKVIEQVLSDEDFNQTRAANRLGINRATLWRKLKN